MTFENGNSKPPVSKKMCELIKSGRPQRQAFVISSAQARRIGAKIPKPPRRMRIGRKKR